VEVTNEAEPRLDWGFRSVLTTRQKILQKVVTKKRPLRLFEKREKGVRSSRKKSEGGESRRLPKKSTGKKRGAWPRPLRGKREEGGTEDHTTTKGKEKR